MWEVRITTCVKQLDIPFFVGKEIFCGRIELRWNGERSKPFFLSLEKSHGRSFTYGAYLEWVDAEFSYLLFLEMGWSRGTHDANSNSHAKIKKAHTN
jgi:hypothetical protein